MNTWNDRNEKALKIINKYFYIHSLEDLNEQLDDGILYGKALNLIIMFDRDNDIDKIIIEPLSGYHIIFEKDK